MPPLVDLLGLWTSLGNVDRRGVNAVTTFRADLRMLARISHDRFFARYHSTAEIIPTIQTDTAQTIIAIIAPLESVMDPESVPDAPASESPTLEPADDPTSPADGPFPGC